MKNSDAVSALAALAQENRLDVFRLLVQAGPEGMPAGEVADALNLAPNNLTFHSTACGKRALSPCSAKAAR
jgi:ArsR family transcriptional regulator, arsenate/arsenite/antimonite-responsive transcriptional repressor